MHKEVYIQPKVWYNVPYKQKLIGIYYATIK